MPKLLFRLAREILRALGRRLEGTIPPGATDDLLSLASTSLGTIATAVGPSPFVIIPLCAVIAALGVRIVRKRRRHRLGLPPSSTAPDSSAPVGEKAPGQDRPADEGDLDSAAPSPGLPPLAEPENDARASPASRTLPECGSAAADPEAS